MPKMLVQLGSRNEPLVAGGPWAGEAWPIGMLDGPMGRIGQVNAQVITPLAQIEIKQMTPTWNPKLKRRQKGRRRHRRHQVGIRAATIFVK